MFSRSMTAGAVALLAAPIVVIAGTLAQPTLSDDAASQVAALTGHRGAMITGMTLSSIAVVLLIAGIIWLALALAPRAPRLAMAGGVLGVFGLLVVMFENSVAAAGPAIVTSLDRIQATFALDRIHSGAAITALGPLSITGDIGLALLGIAAVKAGATRWAGAAIVAGALGYGAGLRDRHQGPGDHRVRGSFRWPAANRAHPRRVPQPPAGRRRNQSRRPLLSALGTQMEVLGAVRAAAGTNSSATRN